MVFAWRWSRSCLLAGCEGFRRGADDHGRPSVGQGKFHGPRVHRSRSAFAAPLAHGQSRAPAISARPTRRTADDHRSCFRGYCPVASRLAQPALDRPIHGTVDVVDLLAASASGRRSSGPGGPTDGPWAHRARVVAWPRTHRPDSRPAPRNLACSHGPIHALDHCRLDSGHQWRIPRGRFDLADAAIGPRDAVELERALDTFAREPNGGAIVTAAASTTAHREFLNSLAMRHRLPTIHAFRYMILSGGLASYGPDTIDIFKRAA